MRANSWLKKLNGLSLDEANAQLQDFCGISDFLNSIEEIEELSDRIFEQGAKDEYGDWQTHYDLAREVCLLIKEKGIAPQIIIEPTCGKGAFLLAATEIFDDVERMYGIEIYKPYLNDLKLHVLENTLNRKCHPKRLELFHCSIFGFDFSKIKRECEGKNILILGNPPWVTNSKLCSINSNNIPHKSNFKNHKGIEAITGKGNFDIAEYICNMMIREFSQSSANLAFLIKNSVIKNIVQRQRIANQNIRKIEQYNIDAAKEFGVSVSASLLFMEFGTPVSLECNVFDFYSHTKTNSFGWVNDKFVSNTEIYRQWQNYDNISQLEWWSGIKHDCSKVMELVKNDKCQYANALGELVDIEDDLVYPLAKSSDIYNGNISQLRKYVIVTQHTPSESTEYIKKQYPKAYAYLMRHADLLDGRASIIYKKRPRFAMFGIGEYSFKKYKVAISSLYKTPRFTLVEPINGRPVMLDDTCYLIGFDTKDEAQAVLHLLNHDTTQVFLHTLMFPDAKRVISKDILMRIDIAEVYNSISDKTECTVKYIQTLMRKEPRQLELF